MKIIKGRCLQGIAFRGSIIWSRARVVCFWRVLIQTRSVWYKMPRVCIKTPRILNKIRSVCMQTPSVLIETRNVLFNSLGVLNKIRSVLMQTPNVLIQTRSVLIQTRNILNKTPCVLCKMRSVLVVCGNNRFTIINNWRSTPPMFEQTFKNIDDILHKDAGCEVCIDSYNNGIW